MLSVPSDHRVKVRAEGRVRVIVAEPSNHCAFGALDGVLHLVGHLQSCNSLHLKTPAQELCVSTGDLALASVVNEANQLSHE